MSKSASYVFTAYNFILSNSYEAIINVGSQLKEGNPIPSFDEDLLIELCSNVQEIFEKEDNILQIEGDLIIVGDIHGSLHDLLRILKYIQENKSKVLFLGDYVDRGNFSLECITLLFALKVLYPDQFFLIRGNHEFETMCSNYGFKDEIINYHNPKKLKKILFKNKIDLDILDKYDPNNFAPDNADDKIIQCEKYFNNHNDANCYKYSEKLYDSFISSFNYLPIAAISNKNNFCIHGGLSPRLDFIQQIQNGIKRPISSFDENQLFTDIIWSDPSSSFSFLFEDNPRGRGFLFSSSATYFFLENNSLKRIIRGHQCVKYGLSSYFNDKCITVFSSSSYSKEMGNSAGILKIFQKNNQIENITFPPLKRLQKVDASYYKVQNEKIKINMCFSIIHPKLISNTSMKKKNIHCRLKSHRSDLSSYANLNLSFITNSRKSKAINENLSNANYCSFNNEHSIDN